MNSLSVRPAEDFVGKPDGALCVVVPHDITVTARQIWAFATANNAVVDDPDDAPDDEVIVAFGGGRQELLTETHLVARLRDQTI